MELWAGKREKQERKTKGERDTECSGSRRVLPSSSSELLLVDFGDKISIRNKSREKCHFLHYLVAAGNIELFFFFFSLSSRWWMPLRSVFLCLWIKTREMFHKQPCARVPFMLKKGSLWKPNGHRGTQILSQRRSCAKFSILSMNTDDWGFIK